MFIEFKEKNEYYDEYINILALRMAYANISMEFKDADLALPNMALPIKNFKDAMMFLFDNQDPEQKIYPSVIQKVNAIINRGKYLNEGYRKVNVLTGLKFEAPAAFMVPNQMMSLLDNYYNVWTDLSPYERQAKFALNFIRIQPFEDGNKRTASVLINFNLCASQNAPIIIDKAHTEEYLRCINEYDEQGLTALFEKLSQIELGLMVQLYQQLYFDKDNSSTKKIKF